MHMNNKNIKAVFPLLLISIAALYSCRKDDSKKEYGFSRIFMPQAIVKSGGANNNYPVPSGSDSSTFNFSVNPATNKVEIILGATLSGPQRGAYSVNIEVDQDTVQALLASKVFDPAVHQPMPASMYRMPERLDVAEGAKSGSFKLELDIPQLKQSAYVGKVLLLAVQLASPSAYELNPALSTTLVVVDVNALVIGPAVNVTGQYIKNPGNPFVAEARWSSNNRWGTLKDWTANAAAKSHGGFGSWSSDNGGTMNMESGWGSPQILNGKIYQTITLPAGRYAFDISGGNWSGGENFMKDIGYSVVALNLDSLPDYGNITGNSAVLYQPFSKPNQAPINFVLPATTTVTVGVVVNYVQNEQGFKSKQVILNTFPKAL